MMKSRLTKVYNALGNFRYSSNPQSLGFTSNVRNERSSMVRPEPCDQSIIAPPNAEDAKYEEWLIDHPSALKSFEGMMSIAKGKKIIVFLDYDGTLSPIVDDPDLAFMPDMMRSAVREVARYFPTAIVSGRSRDKVHEFVKLNDVYYAGSHGMDIMAPPRMHKSGDCKYQTLAVDKKGNEVSLFQPAQDFLPEILEIFNELEEETKVIEGVTVEDNRFCISVHFRRAKEEDYSLVERKVMSILAKHSRFRLTRGRKVLEIRPSIKWNKGNALEYLLDTLGFAESNDVLPIYIGDDTTDEDAFKVIQKRGQGFAILVSLKPKETRASYSLRDPSEVLTFLLRLARWRRNSSSSKPANHLS
ncbi:hypothetical protein BVRB_3g052380 [Beta vulgaris subsp. vulgaris]|uniref:probable trehalose-phosphate phosphatase 2 n=1 Tax=Beta vulgaris subsp. vulgaris TaxID=3555 RepID=UPI00065C5609|nr:probable trehalose-phosphate phosphatase 2 [Beta vulgaris subsp. vulgaris]KMT16067.1 hypothetical protein BVRB_3g052380 [Beta vulgaris subsp. vulgaris]